MSLVTLIKMVWSKRSWVFMVVLPTAQYIQVKQVRE